MRALGEIGQILLSCGRPQQVPLCVGGPTSSLFALSRGQMTKLSQKAHAVTFTLTDTLTTQTICIHFSTGFRLVLLVWNKYMAGTLQQS